MEQSLLNRIEKLSKDERYFVSMKLKELIKEKAKTISTENKAAKLVAYIEPKNNDFDLQNLKSHLKEHVPDYMIPSNINVIEEFPLLPNGKIDRSKLKEVSTIKKEMTIVKEVKNENLVEKATNDNTSIQDKLTIIWEEVLNFSPILPSDNFFEIGGDSILSIQIIAKARKLGMVLTPNQLFDHQTIAELTNFIANNEKQEEKWDYLVALRKEGNKKPLFCIHSGGGHVFFYNLLTDHIDPERPIYALQPSGLDGKGYMHQSIEEMTTDYIKTIRTIQPEGPYNVLAYCFSTAVGNEMAIQLEKQGQKTNIIVMDTMASPWVVNTKDRLKIRFVSFFKKFFKTPVKTLNRFFVDRKWMIEPIKVKFFGKRHEKDLEKLKANLRKICVAYKWTKHSGKVSLILTKKEDQGFQDLIIDSWKELATGGVDISYTKGKHHTLFEKSDIAYVSEKIDQSIAEE